MSDSTAGDAALLGLDEHGTVRWISPDAAALLGSGADAVGEAVESLVEPAPGGPSVQSVLADGGGPLRSRAPGGGLLRARIVRPYGTPDRLMALRAGPGGMALLHEVATHVGASLDVRTTARALADVLVPELGDLAAVNLAEAVLSGDEPPEYDPSGPRPSAQANLRRIAVAGPWGPEGGGLGTVLPDFWVVPGLERMRAGRVLHIPRPADLVAGGSDPVASRKLVPLDAAAGLSAPLYARGLILGSVAVWRTTRSRPFDDEDARLLEDVASRAALAVDNARRYTREHRTAVTLQQRLLPPADATTAAGDTAGIYLPAKNAGRVSGDWFDVVRLSSERVALVVGDVFGHGLTATATMARLRTAVQTLADLDLDPGEVLAHVDDLVQRLAAETDTDTVGATCAVAVYDPVTGRLALASAGHPPPVFCDAAGVPTQLPVSPGPPLGVGGVPFEVTESRLEPGGVLALYTDGLLNRPDPEDLPLAPEHLGEELARHLHDPGPLQDIGARVLHALCPEVLADDAALLLMRPRTIPESRAAAWEFPAEKQQVAAAREAAAEQLEQWGLDESVFGTELIVSELVTNAIRYAGGPVRLRLLRTDVLVCEVEDPSNTQPRPRKAHETDEGGRGLFLVSQLTTRWGSRYRQQGKTIWAEQKIDAPG